MRKSRPRPAATGAVIGRLSRLVLLIAAAALLGSMLQSTSAAAGGSSAKPTIVLVHGAWADGSSWNQVT